MKEAWNAPIVPPSPPPSRWYSHPHIVDNHLSSMHVICVDADADAGADDGERKMMMWMLRGRNMMKLRRMMM
jgi:hypothetical protein